jgi:hypothetical protein
MITPATLPKDSLYAPKLLRVGFGVVRRRRCHVFGGVFDGLVRIRIAAVGVRHGKLLELNDEVEDRENNDDESDKIEDAVHLISPCCSNFCY